MKTIIKTGNLIGTGAFRNVELGFIPTSVVLYNASDGTTIQQAFLGWVMPFSSGGLANAITNTLAPGSTIRGATSAATATVQEVLQSATGSFAAGTAAGFLVLQEGSLTGTFVGENIVITNPSSGTLNTDDATVTANVVHNCAITTAAAAATSAATTIARYEGTVAGTGKGFTIGNTLFVADKLFRYMAVRDDA